MPDELDDPPSDLAPAVVSLLQANGHDIGPEAIAATILDLAQRRVVVIEGITSERYTLKVVGSSQRRGEAALLVALGQASGAAGVIVGPPLPVKRDGEWWSSLRGDVVSIARRRG